MLQWICGHIYIFELVFSFSLNKCLQVEFLDHPIALVLIFRRASVFFSTWLHRFWESPKSVQGFPFLYILANTYSLSFFNSHCDRSEVVPHCGFDLHFFDDYWSCWLPVYLLWENVYSDSLLTFHFFVEG